MTKRRTVTSYMAGLFIVSVLLRGWALNRPGTFVFDEVYYANDAVDLLTRGAERGFSAHPPLGKWLIAVGIQVGGFDPIGWRIAAVVCGAVTVLLAYYCALQLIDSPHRALIVPILVLLDGIAFSTSRYALLDGFAAMVVVGIVATLLSWRNDSSVRSRVCVVGMLCGLAAAIKWTTLPAVAVGALYCVVRSARVAKSRRAKMGLATFAMFAATCLLAYVASYSGWIVGGKTFGDCDVASCSGGPVHRIVELPRVQWDMARHDIDLHHTNPYLASGWRWLLQDRPTVLLADSCRQLPDPACEDHRGNEIKAQGNPVLWAGALAAAMPLAYRRRTGRRQRDGSRLLVFVFIGCLWAPWVLDRFTYAFYAAPIVPLLALGLGGELVADDSTRASRVIACGVVVSSLAIFVARWTSLD